MFARIGVMRALNRREAHYFQCIEYAKRTVENWGELGRMSGLRHR
jgi:hypothetical protein